jgi:hypothetical protein
MRLPQKFATQLAKTEKTRAKLEEANAEYNMRVEGYKDEGRPFSERMQSSLLSSIRHRKKVLANQSAQLLKLHALMSRDGDPADPTFDRELYEKLASG